MKKLRVAILINNYTLSVWAVEMIERLEQSDHCDLIAYVLPANPLKKRSRLQNFRSNLPYVLYKLYSVADRKLFKGGKKDPFRLKMITNGTVREIRLPVKRNKYRDKIEEKELQELAALQPDILVRLGFRILSGPILKLARYGVWSYHHADNRVNRGGPAGLWGIINQEPNTGITLQVLSEDLDGGTVLYRGLSKTYSWSWYRNKCHYYWKSVFILPREVERLASLGEQAFYDSKKALNSSLAFYSYPLYRKPRNARMLRFLIAHAGRLCHKALYDLFCEEYWKIGILNIGKSRELRKAEFLSPPRNTIWADPFYYREEETGNEYIFCEKQYKNRDGVIEYFVRKKGAPRFEGPYPCLAEDHHLSFPNVFYHHGHHYMLPEAGASQELKLYKAKKFPDNWEYCSSLLDGRFVDPVLCYHDGLYWLFVNKADHPHAPAADELHLFYSDNANLSEWKGHHLNPVVTNVRYSRNAGNIVTTASGELYRVSQKINRRYGEAVQYNRIEILSPEEYRETWQGELAPSFVRHGLGLHTVQKNDKTFVFDLAAWRWRFSSDFID